MVTIYHLQGKASILGDYLVKMKEINEEIISWRKFKKYFKKEYIFEFYYHKNMEDLFKLKLGTMTMEAYEKRFLEFLKYVYFVKDEKVNIHRFVSGLPYFYSDKIQYDRSKNLKEFVWMTKNLYDQNKNKFTHKIY